MAQVVPLKTCQGTLVCYGYGTANRTVKRKKWMKKEGVFWDDFI